MRSIVVLILLLGASLSAERLWQTGTWTDVGVKRKVVDFGPGASGFGRPSSTPTMQAMADVHTYVIEAGDTRYELEDVVQVGRRSVEAAVGQSVTFAIDKKTVYVRDPDGAEHKLRLRKKSPRTNR